MKSIKQRIIKKILKSKGFDEFDDVKKTIIILKILTFLVLVICLSLIISIL